MASNTTTLKVMTYNIRVNTLNDWSLIPSRNNTWYYRKDSVINLIRRYSPDLFGVQEALSGQMSGLRNGLYDYDSYGVGRDDGREGGEFGGVFYRCDRFEWLEDGTFWLSDTGEIGERGWGADCPRICSWVKLKDRKTEKEIYHFNTHLDHRSCEAREKSADLILKKIKEKAGSTPVILTGDFNTESNSRAYRTIINDSDFGDAKELSEESHEGPNGTWSTFNVEFDIDSRIDYIFITPTYFKTLTHQHLTDHHNNKYYPSDHLPVLAKLDYKTHRYQGTQETLVGVDVVTLEDLESAAKHSGDRAAKVEAVFKVAEPMTRTGSNLLIFDLSQKRVNHLQGIQFFEKVYIDGTPFGVWIFKRGTFENKGELGKEHWIMSGKHNFKDGQLDGNVTFYGPEEVNPSDFLIGKHDFPSILQRVWMWMRALV
ncbi:hypothetical protein I4U23_022237 [Adineta vaga]|nr:hypothetical protein I4U23_022237 [Adineta vaga]